MHWLRRYGFRISGLIIGLLVGVVVGGRYYANNFLKCMFCPSDKALQHDIITIGISVSIVVLGIALGWRYLSRLIEHAARFIFRYPSAVSSQLPEHKTLLAMYDRLRLTLSGVHSSASNTLRTIDFNDAVHKLSAFRPNKKILLIAFVPLLLLFLFLQSSNNGEFAHIADVLPCDELAADPSDPHKAEGVSGIPLDKIAASKAAEACNDAAKEYPNSRFTYQLARALSIDDPYSALEQYEKAIDLGYPAATIGLARLYAKGIIKSDDQETDAYDAITLMAFAKDNGYQFTYADYAMEEALWRQYFETVFTDENYGHPDFMTALYKGNKDALNLGEEKNRERAIFTYMNIREYCGYSGERSEGGNSLFLLRGFVYPIIKKTGDNVLNMALIPTDTFLSKMSEYEPDAALFVARHGCEGPVFADMINHSESFYEELSESIVGSKTYRLFASYIQQTNQIMKGLQQLFRR